MKGFVRVAAATPKVLVADPAANSLAIIGIMRDAGDSGVKVLVLPELCVTGYTCGDLFHQETLIGGAYEALSGIVSASAGLDMLVVLGAPIAHENKLYNCAVFIFEGRILAVVPKLNIPNYNEFYEFRYFTPGRRRAEEIEILGQAAPFGADILIDCDNIPGLSIAAEICEDLWVPIPPSTFHALSGATLIVNPSASDETIAKAEYRRGLVTGLSARTLSAYVYAGAGSGESTGDLTFSGHNIIAENGIVLGEAALYRDETIAADVDILRLIRDRARMTTYPAARGRGAHHTRVSYNYASPAAKCSRTFDKAPFVPRDKGLRDLRCEEILTMQAVGLKKRLEHVASSAAIVGVSGGLDSTLALLVSVKAFDMMGLDRSGVVGISMPCFGTSERTRSNSIKLMEALNVTYREIPITEAVRGHLRDIGHDESDRNVTYENAQARERTQVLMDVANDCGGLVVGTGDMSELALGWCTYNGDHMSMYAVNAGVPKTLVRYLVEYYAETEECVREVLKDILDTPISPELIPPDSEGHITQKTEERIGPYELHDFFLYYMLRYGFEPERIYEMAVSAFSGEYDAQTVLKWLKVFYRRFFSQQFKRSCVPDGPKIGSIALSPRGDLRMPSDASAALWLSALEKL